MKALTIRNVDPSLARALERERRKRNASLNSTVLLLLRSALGVAEEKGEPSNGLKRLAGGWSEKDLREFEEATAAFGQVDDELWS